MPVSWCQHHLIWDVRRLAVQSVTYLFLILTNNGIYLSYGVQQLIVHLPVNFLYKNNDFVRGMSLNVRPF